MTSRYSGTAGRASSKSVTPTRMTSPLGHRPALRPTPQDRTVDNSVTTPAMSSDARAPHTHWLHTSWPMSLVPNRCAEPGGVSGAPLGSPGSCVASTGANSALRISKPSTASASARRLNRTRVQVAVDHIEHEIGQQHAQAGQEEDGLKDGVVARLDSLEREQPKARDGEDPLDYDRAAQHLAEPHAKHRQDGQQRVGRRVLERHAPLTQAC